MTRLWIVGRGSENVRRTFYNRVTWQRKRSLSNFYGTILRGREGGYVSSKVWLFRVISMGGRDITPIHPSEKIDLRVFPTFLRILISWYVYVYFFYIFHRFPLYHRSAIFFLSLSNFLEVSEFLNWFQVEEKRKYLNRITKEEKVSLKND